MERQELRYQTARKFDAQKAAEFERTILEILQTKSPDEVRAELVGQSRKPVEDALNRCYSGKEVFSLVEQKLRF